MLRTRTAVPEVRGDEGGGGTGVMRDGGVAAARAVHELVRGLGVGSVGSSKGALQDGLHKTSSL